jgi:hypothetical protein
MLDTPAGISLKELLLSHPAYEKAPEMVIDAMKFLEGIAVDTEGEEETDDDWGIPTDRIKSAFQRSRRGYTELKDALEGLNLLELTEEFDPPNNLNGYKGVTNHYRVTAVYKGFYEEAATEWRLSAEDHSKYVRKRGRRIREAKAIPDAFSRMHELLSCTVEMDWEAVPQSGRRHAIARGIMGRLQRVEFKRIENDGESSRLYHPLTNMPKEFRLGLWAGNLAYSGEVDARACWPTFLAAQLRELNPEGSEAFKAECKAWTDAFCDEKKDPRKTIRLETGLPITDSEMKDCLNKYLNGSLQATLEEHRKPSPRYTAVDGWFASRYPEMHKVWEAEDPSSLARKIGQHFETPLMTNKELYDYAAARGIMLYYQYDGFGVFANPGRQEELEEVLAGLCRLIHDISIEKFGVPIVVKRQIMAL